MATAIIGSSVRGLNSFGGDERAWLTKEGTGWVRCALPSRTRPMMRNVNEGKGLLAPLVVVARNITGKKRGCAWIQVFKFCFSMNDKTMFAEGVHGSKFSNFAFR
ncbi:hypothetical protein AMTR_s00059p00149900 [Amborella trichopoda]|uniref:Uncharacterized protein n=1 Tax=Amborella trichopoda TaxID=13333 RepID=U5D5U9_AMBTC|nr:hypothetical protein AMTR_s00059p00149900 [Amborella trichopoda]